MRLFSDVEKEFLTRLNQNQGGSILQLMLPYTGNAIFELNIATSVVTFKFAIDNPDAPDLLNIAQERISRIQTIVIESVNILKLFEEKGYIFTYKNANRLPDPIVFGGFAGGHSISYNFPDSGVSQLFCEYATREIKVTKELARFIDDGYITRDVWRTNRQFYTTLIALIVAIFGFFLNIYINWDKNEEKPPIYKHHRHHKGHGKRCQ